MKIVTKKLSSVILAFIFLNSFFLFCMKSSVNDRTFTKKLGYLKEENFSIKDRLRIRFRRGNCIFLLEKEKKSEEESEDDLELPNIIINNDYTEESEEDNQDNYMNLNIDQDMKVSLKDSNSKNGPIEIVKDVEEGISEFLVNEYLRNFILKNILIAKFLINLTVYAII